MDFTVSVIIPTYNVEDYIEKTIASVLIQPEVTEIIVVDDGSKDNTLLILKQLKKQHHIIEIFQHENEVNKGRSATRNLGILNATSNYIAFLDADDFYLCNRFTKDRMILMDQAIDGVYNAVGFSFYKSIKDETSKHFKLSKKIESKNLFDAIVSSKYGYLHLNGLTLKKTNFDVIGLFNESLIVAEDSDIIFKLALKCKLEPSIIEIPVAKRGVHDNNVFTDDDLYKKYNVKLYESLLNWSGKHQISYKNIDTLLNWLWFFKFRETNSLKAYLFFWVYIIVNNPKLFFTKLSFKYFPLIRLRQKFFPFLFKNH